MLLSLPLDFIASGGVSELLSVPSSSLAAGAVAQCFYFISCDDDSLEKMCLLQEPILEEVIKYMLGCLDSAHESGKQFATMFVGNACAFR